MIFLFMLTDKVEEQNTQPPGPQVVRSDEIPPPLPVATRDEYDSSATVSKVIIHYCYISNNIDISTCFIYHWWQWVLICA
jgi:hypothetical protein